MIRALVGALGGREALHVVGERMRDAPGGRRSVTFQSSSFHAQVCFSQFSSSRFW